MMNVREGQKAPALTATLARCAALHELCNAMHRSIVANPIAVMRVVPS